MSKIFNLYKEAFKDAFIPPKRGLATDKPRIQFIDLAKGVCILLVCSIHTGLGDSLPYVLTFLRIPLYFVLSGMFFKDYGGFLNLAEKKINKILIPALFFYSLSYPLYKLCESLGLWEDKGGHFFSFLFSDIRYCYPVWFLFSLFFSNLIFCIIKKLAKDKSYLILTGCIMCSIAGYVFYKTDVRPLLYIDTSLTMMPYFFLGWWLRKIEILNPHKFDRILFYLSLAIIAVILLLNDHLSQYRIIYMDNQFPETGVLFSFIIGALFVVSTLFFLKRLSWLPLISYFGRFSIIILLIHTQLLAASRAVLSPENEFAVLVLTMLLLFLMIPMIKQYLPYVTAQKDSIHIISKKSN